MESNYFYLTAVIMKKEKKLTHEVCVNQTKTLLYIVSTFKK